jgi:uncharacterized protein YeaO (DUF488 family)
VTAPGRPSVELRRVYEDIPGGGPTRVLIDRLWPRGIAKATAPFDQWLKEVAPTTGLRQWYGHDPAKFKTFAARYRHELRTSPASDGVARLATLAAEGGVVLVTATRDVEHSAAEVLFDLLLGPP